ncbi:MAG: PKD domain-containing protein [Bacteroidales bacterium]|nr:PKD domain-containing protein [Bacteroidales bacterium]MCF8458522.1 PKD domain-containing protein [Bacteroidales bacterium]
MRKTIILISLIVAGMMGTTFAQGNFIITGTVTGSVTGQVIPNHEVNIVDSLSGTMVTTLTDAIGVYTATMYVMPGTQPMYIIYTMGLCGPNDYYYDVAFINPLFGATVNFTICDSVTNPNYCSADFTYFVDYNILGSPNQALITFTDLSVSSSTITNWMWTFANGTVSNDQNPVVTYTYAAGTISLYNVCLTITASNQCTSTYCYTIQIGDTLINPTPYCEAFFFPTLAPNVPPGSDTYIFNNQSWATGNILSYAWSFGDGTTSTDFTPTHTYTTISPDTFEVCLTILTSDSCTSTYCDYIVTGNPINPFCQADFYFYPDSASSVSPFIYEFVDMSIGNVVSYEWIFDNGQVFTTPNVTFAFPGYGIYTVCLSIETSDSCSSSLCQTIVVDSMPQVNCEAMFYYNIGIFSNSSFYDASWANSPIVSWYWDFGDGTSSTQQMPIHNYSSIGWYNVCLTIVSASGCTDTYCENIYYAGNNTGNCQADFSYANPITPNGNTFVEFTDMSTAASSSYIIDWYWNFGDNTSSTLPNPTHIYASPGFYQVCLDIFTSDSCSATFCDLIMVGDTLVNPYCEAMFIYGALGTVPFSFTDLSTSTGNIIGWYWDFGDNTTSTLQNPTHQFATSGMYNVCLTITADNGCTSIFCDNVYFNNTGNCFADFYAYTNNPAGVGLDYAFQDISIGNVISWLWDFGDNTTSTLQNPFHSYPAAGMYNVCLTIGTSDSCSSTSCQNIFVIDTIVSNCQAGFVYGGTGGLFLPGVFTDASTSTGNIIDWLWDFGDGAVSTLQNPVHNYNSIGYYQVCLTIVTDLNCTNTYCATIYYDPTGTSFCNAEFNYTYTPNTVCNYEYQFTDMSFSTSTIMWWTWTFGDGSTSTDQNPSHCFMAIGTYQVCLEILTADSCISSFCEMVTVSGNPTTFNVSGAVYAGSSIVTNGVVLLMGSTGSIYAADMSPMGGYFVQNVVEDTYIALAIPSYVTYPNYVPTYYDTALFWNTAIEIALVSDTSNIDIHLQGYNSTLTGPGTITGNIIWIGTKNTNTYKDRMNVSVEDISVMLFDMSDNLLSYDLSDASGGFQFTNLPYGTYKIYVELAGHVTYPAIVTIDVNNPTINDIVFDIDNGTVYYDVEEIAGIGSDAVVYPNPAHNDLYVEFTLSNASDVKVSALSTLGQEVLSDIQNLPSGKQNLHMDVSGLESGIYFISIEAIGQNKQVLKFVK